MAVMMKTNDAGIQRLNRHGLNTVLMTRGAIAEAVITVRAERADRLDDAWDGAWNEARTRGLTVLRQDVFGASADRAGADEMLRRVCGRVDWPVTWVARGTSGRDGLCGTHLYAVAGVHVRRLTHGGMTVGSVFEDGHAAYCHLAGIVSSRPADDPMRQTRDIFVRIGELVEQAGMTFHHVARTWFYNELILDWYDSFNDVRTAFFRERGVFDTLVPASTGVGGINLHGASVVADALAIRPLDGHGEMTIREVRSPLQCPAPNYRSSFSRAVEVAGPDHRRLYVSGTASIGPDGESIHHGDLPAQIKRTLDVITTLLGSCGMNWSDTARATGYVKRGADRDAVVAELSRAGLDGLPLVLTENEVCRDELLFELELETWQARASRSPQVAGL